MEVTEEQRGYWPTRPPPPEPGPGLGSRLRPLWAWMKNAATFQPWEVRPIPQTSIDVHSRAHECIKLLQVTMIPPMPPHHPARMQHSISNDTMHACMNACKQEVSCQDLAPKSLIFLKKDSWLRKPFICLIRWRIFDWFFLLAIFANCITLAM